MLSLTALIANLRKATPATNVFSRTYSAPNAAKAWAELCLAMANFVDAMRKDGLSYSLTLRNIDYLRSSFPALDVEALAEEYLKNNPPAPKPTVPAMPADVEKLSEAEQDALAKGFAAALDALPTAVDPFDKKEA